MYKAHCPPISISELLLLLGKIKTELAGFCVQPRLVCLRQPLPLGKTAYKCSATLDPDVEAEAEAGGDRDGEHLELAVVVAGHLLV